MNTKILLLVLLPLLLLSVVNAVALKTVNDLAYEAGRVEATHRCADIVESI